MSTDAASSKSAFASDAIHIFARSTAQRMITVWLVGGWPMLREVKCRAHALHSLADTVGNLYVCSAKVNSRWSLGVTRSVCCQTPFVPSATAFSCRSGSPHEYAANLGTDSPRKF